MSITGEIDDIHIHYLHENKNVKTISQYRKKSVATIKKYITIKEELDMDLYPLLNNRRELTLDIALTLCKLILNPLLQMKIFPSLQGLTSKDKKTAIKDFTLCTICCDSKNILEVLPCCNNILCTECLINIIKTSVNELIFQLVCCPYCRDLLPIDFLRDLTKSRIRKSNTGIHERREYYSIDQWRYTSNYLNKINHRFLYNNLFKKYHAIIHHLQRRDNMDMDENHYGYCYTCIKNQYETKDRFINNLYRGQMYFARLRIVEVPKNCVQDVELNESMFKCEPCRDEEENVVIKSCPHCGIKSIKPINCNYVKCACRNFWCFVCNMRLPDSNEGHNIHFWRGRGTSAYDNACRVSTNRYGEKHVLQSCNCEFCRKRNGAPMCATIDCRRLALENTDDSDYKYNQYCFVCN